MQNDLLAAHPNANTRVYSIWFNMYPTDTREAWPRDVLTDSRVMHFWDEKKLVGQWYTTQMDAMQERLVPDSRGLGGPVLWDAYLLYGPEARWEGTIGGLRSWGRTVIGTRETLAAEFKKVAAD